MLFGHFEYFNLELELLVELLASFEDLQSILLAMFVVHHLQHLAESPRA